MARKKKGRPLHGWLAINKPKGITSTACVGWLKRLYGPQKIGHGGTLDPLADGILPIAMGEATKTVQWAMDAEKTYEFTISWGESRTTLDAEGEITARSDTRPTQDAVEQYLVGVIGEIDQIPPQFSAVKIGGARAYDLARNGEDFEIQPRIVLLKRARLIAHDTASTTLEIVTGKGFYVRALARDLAAALGCEGYVCALKRTAVGALTLHNSITPDTLEEMEAEARDAALLPIDFVLGGLPVVDIAKQYAGDISQGRAVITNARDGEDLAKVLAKSADQPLALGRTEKGIFYPQKVFVY